MDNIFALTQIACRLYDNGIIMKESSANRIIVHVIRKGRTNKEIETEIRKLKVMLTVLSFFMPIAIPRKILYKIVPSAPIDPLFI